jgi:hypothetical protein
MRGRTFLAMFLLAVLGLFSPVRAADPPKAAETALAKAPADVEYYRSMLRMGETFETIGRSRAWKQIWDEPALQEFRKKVQEGLGGAGLEPIHKFFADPDNAEIPALAANAFSNEIFVYAGAGTGDLISLFQELAGTARFGPAFLQGLGQNPGDPTRARARLLLQSLAEKPERVRIPDLIIGFKVSEPTKVTAQLKRIDPLLADALKDTPLKGRSKRVKIGDDEFLVLSLDGSLVPWDQVPIAMFEEKEGEFAPLMKHLKAMKLSVAIGVRQGYLLVAIGQSTDAVLKFGGAGPKLAGRPELKPLAKAASKPLTAVSYASAKLRQATATTAEDVTGFADLVKGFTGQLGLPDDLGKSLDKDLESLAQSIAKSLVKPEATFSFSFRTSRGWETFDYDYTPTSASSSKPLTLLNHVGGNPILAAVWRSETTIDDYRALVKWVTTFGGHAEKIARAKFPEGEPIIDTVRKEIFPLLKELSDTTEKLWLPALADGQEGIVIDAKWTSKRWHESMPIADRELPLPELGIIVGVSDADKLGQALEDYRTTLNKLIAKVREQAPPGTVPEFEIPKPKVESKNGRTLAFYPIPEEWGIDKQFQPTGGIAGSVAALALSRAHVERLLSPLPLQTDLAPFADLKRPLDSAFLFNFAELISAAGPWIGFAIDKAEPADKKEAERIAVKVMSILKVFQSYGSATYREGGATITHSEAVFRDILPTGK